MIYFIWLHLIRVTLSTNYTLYYPLSIAQLTPVGLTVFRGIHAVDRDKPNTANSDITYSIVVSLCLCPIFVQKP